MSLWGDKMPESSWRGEPARPRLGRFYSCNELSRNQLKSPEQNGNDNSNTLSRNNSEPNGYEIPWTSIRIRNHKDTKSTISSSSKGNAKHYLRRFGDFFNTTANKSHLNGADVNGPPTNEPLDQLEPRSLSLVSSSFSSNSSSSGDSSKQLCGSSSVVQSSQAKCDENQRITEVQKNKVTEIMDKSCGQATALNSFLLPRIIINNRSSNTSSISNEDSGFERCYDKSGRDNLRPHLHRQQQQQQQQPPHNQPHNRHQSNSNSHQHHNVSSSHYSTEKSGSSGYYGSNLYSTGSVDEHIYSEPVIEKYESRKAAALSTTLSTRRSHILVRQDAAVCDISVEDNIDFLRKKIDKLPTIMEGIDGQIPRPVWPSDYDDSLVDLNLEPFLQQPDVAGQNRSCVINTPNKLTNEVYIQNIKHYEDNLSFQQTRSILEDIRQKLNHLLNANNDSNPFRSLDMERKKTEHQIKLEEEIIKLKNDLDEYLLIINQENEKEIKKLCAGLSKDTKLLTLQNALVNKTRSSSIEENPYQIYHNLEFRGDNGLTSSYPNEDKDESHFGSIYVKNGFNVCTADNLLNSNPFSRSTSIRSSDPNFHFQRKPITTNTFVENVTVPNDGKVTPNGNSLTSCSGNNSDSNSGNNSEREMLKDNLKQNLALHHAPVLMDSLNKSLVNGGVSACVNKEKDMILEWHKNKPSIWELYYGKNRPHQTIVKTVCAGKNCKVQSIVSYPSTRPESDFTLDLPRAEQLRVKMKKEKQFRARCRVVLTFLSLMFFLLTVMAVSLLLTRGKRMFGSML